MSKDLKEALGDLKELIGDTKQISHPYTNSHVNETRRRAFRIGASLVGENHSRYLAVLEVGMKTVASVQKRNSEEILQDNSFVGVAGVLSDTPRWEDKLESLEFACASFGLNTVRDGDDGVVVSARTDAGTELIYSKLKSTNKVELLEHEKNKALKAVGNTFLASKISCASVLDRDEMFLFLTLLNESTACEDLYKTLLVEHGVM